MLAIHLGLVRSPRLSVLGAIRTTLAELLGLEGAILRAAPKKRLSRHKHRQKLYAPGDKQIQPLGNLVRCPACGHVKRSHFMCMHCFAEIRTFLKAKKKALFGETEPPQLNLDPIDEKLVYPGKRESYEQMMTRQKKWVPQREEPLMYTKESVSVKNMKRRL